MSGPGPEERKLRNRIIFKLTGRWPERVVAERIHRADMQSARMHREMTARLKEEWVKDA